MKEKVLARAYPAIGVLLLGGLKDWERRVPAYSNAGISVTDNCECVRTETLVERLPQENEIQLSIFDVVEGKEIRKNLDNKRIDDMKKMVLALQDLAGLRVGLKITSRNFGIISGSSDSGACALALAVSNMFDLKLDAKVTDIARQGSESVYRSLLGGLSLTEIISNNCHASLLLSNEQLQDLTIFVIGFKEINRHSSDEIHQTIVKHPDFPKRVASRSKMVEELKEAAKKRDIIRIMQIAEQDTMNFHYLLEWCGLRVIKDRMFEALNYVRQLRENGHQAYFIITGGSAVNVLCLKKDSREISKELTKRFPAVEYKVAGPASIVQKLDSL